MATAVIDVTSARSGELLGTTDGETWGWWALGGMIVLWPVGIAAGIGSIIGTITSPPTAVVHPTIELRELAGQTGVVLGEARRRAQPAAQRPHDARAGVGGAGERRGARPGRP